MEMILQLLVAAVTVSLGVDADLTPVPPYGLYVEELKQAADTLRKNVVSMEGNIPLLNDSRRHYAEIVHVINYHAIQDSGCVRVPYYEYYQNFVNTSASEAIQNPEKVVAEIGNLIVEVHANISEIEELIAACLHQNTKLCDELIDDTVKENDDQYGGQAKVLIAAGRAAVEFNLQSQQFEEVSKALTAHQYVLTSPTELKPTVNRVSKLYQILHPLYPPVANC